MIERLLLNWPVRNQDRHNGWDEGRVKEREGGYVSTCLSGCCPPQSLVVEEERPPFSHSQIHTHYMYMYIGTFMHIQ